MSSPKGTALHRCGRKLRGNLPEIYEFYCTLPSKSIGRSTDTHERVVCVVLTRVESTRRHHAWHKSSLELLLSTVAICMVHEQDKTRTRVIKRLPMLALLARHAYIYIYIYIEYAPRTSYAEINRCRSKRHKTR